MKPFSTEFDLSVLSPEQQEWLLSRAENHHFSTCFLDRINNEGAVLTIHYDDDMKLVFFVSPDAGIVEVIGT